MIAPLRRLAAAARRAAHLPDRRGARRRRPPVARRDRAVLRRHAADRHAAPRRRPAAGPARADDPADPRLGRLAREEPRRGVGRDAPGNVGVGPLRRAGFNVLTWDSRGFGDSGGVVQVDGPSSEGRDVQVLLDWLAKQPEALLDGPGDPRAGMEGVSYAGGIELVAAGLDKRIDAIAPTIAWHSLLTSLYPEELIKGGWSSALVAAGIADRQRRRPRLPRRPPDRRPGPAHHLGLPVGRRPRARSPSDDRAWFASRGPGDLVKQIRVPTLLVQGTADTLFTLNEAITNLAILRRQRGPGQDGLVLRRPRRLPDRRGRRRATSRRHVIAWMRRYLARDTAVSTGPGFEWLADDAQWRSAPSFPPRHGAPLVGERLGHARHQPERRRLGHARRRRARRPTRSTCRSRCAPSQVARSASRSSTMTYSAHRHRPRPRRSPRSSTTPATSPSATRSRRSRSSSTARRTPSPARSTRSPRASARARSTRCRSSAAARSTDRCARPPRSTSRMSASRFPRWRRPPPSRGTRCCPPHAAARSGRRLRDARSRARCAPRG